MNRIARIFIFGSLFAVIGLTIWYSIDRTSLFRSACVVGLPNFSIPNELDADDVGCAILAPLATYSGVLKSGFEASNFSSLGFPAVPNDSGPNDSRSWFYCPKSGCGDALDKQLDRNLIESCMRDPSYHSGLANIEVQGWVTISKGTFGHLDGYPRAFFAARILKVSPPPDEVVAEMLDVYRRMDFCR